MLFKLRLSKFLPLPYFECFHAYPWNLKILLMTCLYLNDENWRDRFTPRLKILQWHQGPNSLLCLNRSFLIWAQPWGPLLKNLQCTRYVQTDTATYKSPIYATLFLITLSLHMLLTWPGKPFQSPQPSLCPNSTIFQANLYSPLLQSNRATKCSWLWSWPTWICILALPSSIYLTSLCLCFLITKIWKGITPRDVERFKWGRTSTKQLLRTH